MFGMCTDQKEELVKVKTANPTQSFGSGDVDYYPALGGFGLGLKFACLMHDLINMKR